MSNGELWLRAEVARNRQSIEDSRKSSEAIAPEPGPTIGMIVTTWPRLSQTFVLREFLGLEALGVKLRIFSIKIPRDEPVHADVARVRAPVSYLAFRCRWRPIFSANLRLARELRARYFRTWLLGLRHIRYGNILHVLRQMLRASYVADILRREPVDRIHAHFATAPASVAMFASELTGIPYTIAVHANDIFVNARGPLMSAKMERAEAVVTNNQSNRRYLMGRFGTQLEGKTPCIYNGLDLGQFDFQLPRAPVEEPPLLLAVGRLVEKKGFADLIAAVEILHRRGRQLRVEIIGAGPLKERIQRQIEQLHLEQVVRLRGAQSQEIVRAAYRRAALFVLPCVVTADGDRDGIPNALFEAMASGTPVISTAVSAIPELIHSGENGLILAPRNPTMLADAIDRLLAHPELRDRLARAARETVEARFTLDRTARELFALFRQLGARC